MDRRDTLKSMLLAGLGSGLILQSCDQEEAKITAPVAPEATKSGLYGRTAAEKKHDEEILSQKFFTDHELATIAVLCDIILPASNTAGSATEAGVPEFIEFITKDLPAHQTPLRGGIMWLDHYTNATFQKEFISCTGDEQISVVEKIAWPDEVEPGFEQGVAFFTRMRNLTLTGYYTTRMGIDDLGYQGNQPTVWDGVPEEVLKKHGLSYPEDWKGKFIDQSKRNEVAKWDEEGNLV